MSAGVQSVIAANKHLNLITFFIFLSSSLIARFGFTSGVMVNYITISVKMCHAPTSVTGDGIIDFQGPGVDTTDNIGDPTESMLREETGDSRAASSRMTNYRNGM